MSDETTAPAGDEARLEVPGPADQPRMWCSTCMRYQVCVPSGRGFPPDTSRRKLERTCHRGRGVCDIRYRAGVQ